MAYKYSSKIDKDCARAAASDLPVSTKQAIELCKFIRGKKLDRAKTLVQNVLEMKQPLPHPRFNKGGVGHRKGQIGPGRYPQKSTQAVLSLLNSVEANAKFKGLNTENLVIASINANKGAQRMRFGRKRRTVMKRSHIEVLVREIKIKEKAKTKAPKKKDVKPAAESQPKKETATKKKAPVKKAEKK